MSVMQARDDRTILAVDRTEVAEARALSESLAEVRQTSRLSSRLDHKAAEGSSQARYR
jgi:hypothetical protein